MRSFVTKRGEGYVVVQFLIFALIAFGPESLPLLPQFGEGTQRALLPLGLVIGALGVLLTGAGVVNLGSNLTALPHPKDESTLVETGAYRIVRHPIYSGLFFAALGWSLAKGSLSMVLYTMILLLFFDLKSRREERWLSRKFPGYRAYQLRVRKLIPLMY